MRSALPPQVRGATHAETKFRVCGARTKAGGHCTLHTIKWGEQCWIHTPLTDHLKIKESQVPGAGDGLFAWDPAKAAAHRPVFRSGSRIDDYSGEVSTERTLDRKYGADTQFAYAVKADDGKIVNAWKKNDEVTRYANDPRNNVLYNAEFKGDSRTLALWATRDIYHNEEVFVDYSEEFWRHAEPSTLALASRSASRPAVPPVPSRLPLPLPKLSAPKSPPRPLESEAPEEGAPDSTPSQRRSPTPPPLEPPPHPSPPRPSRRRLTLAPGQGPRSSVPPPEYERQVRREAKTHALGLNDHTLWLRKGSHTFKFEVGPEETEAAEYVSISARAEECFGSLVSARVLRWRSPDLAPLLNKWFHEAEVWDETTNLRAKMISEGFSLLQFREALSFWHDAQQNVSAGYTQDFYARHKAHRVQRVARRMAHVLSTVTSPQGYAGLRYFYPAMMMQDRYGRVVLTDFHDVVWRSTAEAALEATLAAMYLPDDPAEDDK